MNALLSRHTMNAMITNVMTALRNEPQRIATSVAGSPPVAARRTSFRSLKSTPPRARPIGGMMTSSTSDVTTVPSAAPMMTPIASASALVLNRNSRNSVSIARA
jgi:hypothetical protein